MGVDGERCKKDAESERQWSQERRREHGGRGSRRCGGGRAELLSDALPEAEGQRPEAFSSENEF